MANAFFFSYVRTLIHMFLIGHICHYTVRSAKLSSKKSSLVWVTFSRADIHMHKLAWKQIRASEGCWSPYSPVWGRDVCIYSGPVPGAIEPLRIRAGLGASPYFTHTHTVISEHPTPRHNPTDHKGRINSPAIPQSLLIWPQERKW